MRVTETLVIRQLLANLFSFVRLRSYLLHPNIQMKYVHMYITFA